MGPMTKYAKAELKESASQNGFIIRITWTEAVTDRRLVWFGFQGCK